MPADKLIHKLSTGKKKIIESEKTSIIDNNKTLAFWQLKAVYVSKDLEIYVNQTN